MKDVVDRCSDFITDIVDVCKKHRVMIKIKEDNCYDDVEFEEFPADTSGYGFILGISDLEDLVRTEVWETIHTKLA